MLRLENIEEQKKLHRADDSFAVNDESLSLAKKRRSEVLRQAREFGLSVSQGKGKEGRINRIGSTARVSSTDVVGATLGEEWAYRLLSGVEHQRSYALMNLSMRKMEGVNVMAPDIAEEGWLFLVSGALGWFAKTVWSYHQYCGLDVSALEATLEETRQRAGLRERFWEGRPRP